MPSPEPVEQKATLLHRKLGPAGVLVTLLVLAAAARLGVAGWNYVTDRLAARVRADIPRLMPAMRAQRQSILAAIEAYHQKLGAYPPDHLVSRNPLTVDAVTNQLLYELVGTVHNPARHTFSAKGFEAVQLSYMQKLFNVETFKNSALETNGITNFLPGFGVVDTSEAHDGPDVNVLTFRDKSRDFDGEVAAKIHITPWRYNSSAPVHNPHGFDLWLELRTDETSLLIGNWKEAE